MATISDMGGRIRSMRKAKGLTQIQLAGRAQITQGTLSSLERGDTVKVQASTLLQLAKALGVNVEYLRTGAETPVLPEMVTVEEAELLHLFRELPVEDQEHLLRQVRHIHNLIERAAGTPSNPFRKPAKTG
jgi:transcriptional regulator with XRE-family HTH domain